MGNTVTADAAGLDMCISYVLKRVFVGVRHPVLPQRRTSYNGVQEAFEETGTTISSCPCALAIFPLNSTIEDQIVEVTLLGISCCHCEMRYAIADIKAFRHSVTTGVDCATRFVSCLSSPYVPVTPAFQRGQNTAITRETKR